MNNQNSHWKKTRKLMYLVLGLWFFFSFFIHFFAEILNNIHFLAGFPLGFYMAAQGSLIAFVIILFWHAKKQNQIDAEHDVHETN